MILLCTLLLYGIVAIADPAPIVGRWRLDAAESADPAKELKGIRESKREKKQAPVQVGPGAGPLAETQQRYWEKANEGAEWQHSKELTHAGPVQRLLESENLEIVQTDNGYLFIYADGFERNVVPNPGGRVFTASGDELVETEIGFTLAFWKNSFLKFETRITDGGKLTERVTTSADGKRLTIDIVIDRRDWKWIAKIKRVFDRVESSGIQTSEDQHNR